MKNKKFCDHCGAKIVEYKHSFSAALAHGLYELFCVKEPINIKYLGLTRNQWDNFQKLRYWGLVEKAVNEEGRRIAGHWSMTEKGIDFIKGRITIPKSVWTFRGDSVRFEGDSCYFLDVHDTSYQQREDYVNSAVAHQI
jgi:hypothetical protein